MDLVNEAVEEANKRIAAGETRIARQLLSLLLQKVPGRDATAGARDLLEHLLELKAATVSYRDTLLELNRGIPIGTHQAMRGFSSVNVGLASTGTAAIESTVGASYDF
jgi:hypothetical protein